MLKDFFTNVLSIESVLTKYILGVAFFILAIFIIKYIAKTLQWATEKFLNKKQIIGRGWVSLIIKHKVLNHLFFAIGLCFLVGINEFFLIADFPKFTTFLLRLINIVIIAEFTLLIASGLSVFGDKYARSVKMPLKGIVQAVQVVCWLVAIILMVSIIVNKEPIYLLGGLTALSAILLLIFKDSILGLVSGFQLSLNDLVRVGDWIVIPGQGADGEVVDILLSTVRVKNWDNTIVNVPAYDLVSHSFTNWRAMSESGARRIKRAINIDIHSIRFLTPEEIEKLKSISLLKDYLARKEKELADYNKKVEHRENIYNTRRLTNIGTFRAYCQEYLKHNPKIAQKFTCMVRQLEPTPEGLPLEIYAFSADTNWVAYEGIQADIFDHLLSIISVFDLKVYERYTL